MSVWSKILPKARIRRAMRELSHEASARNYAQLAQEYAVVGELDQVLRVCGEGLEQYPGNEGLVRIAERTRIVRREDRLRELAGELRSAPRAAVWRETCEILLESAQVQRAEDAAREWWEKTKDAEAQYWRAQARAERFFADRRRDDGRMAFELVDAAIEALPGDERPLRVQLALASRCGAWAEARRALARLLELHPGDPALEARFRTVLTLAENGRTADQALREVEKTGRLLDDDERTADAPSPGSLRPMLQSMIREPGVRASFYVRGATALVQGPHGATAERTARGVREVVAQCRTAARRLGLGQAREVVVEGDFGSLLVVAGGASSGALWLERAPTRHHRELVLNLVGATGHDNDEGGA
jgi:hypothetical protein